MEIGGAGELVPVSANPACALRRLDDGEGGEESRPALGLSTATRDPPSTGSLQEWQKVT